MKTSIFLTVSMVLLSSGLLTAQEKPARMHPALLVIDTQKAFMEMVEPREKEVAVYMINAYLDLFRKKGYPIILIYHSSEEYGVTAGTEHFEFADDIRITAEDTRVIKTYGNGFAKTDLDKVLKEKGCNTLFMCGLSSVGCVLATFFGSKDLDYKAFLLKDAMMSHDSGYTNQIEDIFEAIGYEAVEIMLNNAEK